MKCYPQKVERAKEERREAGRDGHEFPHSTCQHPRPPHGATATGALPAHSLSSVDSACCYPGSDSPQPRLPEGVREAPSKKEDPFPPPDTTEVSKVKIDPGRTATATGLEKEGEPRREPLIPTNQTTPLQRALPPAAEEGEQRRPPMEISEAGLPWPGQEAPRPASSGNTNVRLLTQEERSPASVTLRHSCVKDPRAQRGKICAQRNRGS